MVFSVFIELINMQHRRKSKPVHLRNPYGEESPGEGDETRALEEAGMPGAGGIARQAPVQLLNQNRVV
jgi:hypothetical protein